MKSDLNIESLKFVRTVVGFVHAGVVVQPVLSAKATKITENINKSSRESGGVAPLERTQEVLQKFQQAILPSQATCASAMQEIDAVLRPMIQADREARKQAQTVGADAPPSIGVATERERG